MLRLLRHLMVPNSGHIIGKQQIQALAGPVSAFLIGVMQSQDPEQERSLAFSVTYFCSCWLLVV